jgi:hypothetical protein
VTGMQLSMVWIGREVDGQHSLWDAARAGLSVPERDVVEIPDLLEGRVSSVIRSLQTFRCLRASGLWEQFHMQRSKSTSESQLSSQRGTPVTTPAKPRTLPSSPAVPSRAAVGCRVAVSSKDLSNRRHDAPQRTRVSSFLAFESRSPRSHAPTHGIEGLVLETATEYATQTEAPLWSVSLPAYGHRSTKRGMDAPDAYTGTTT